MYVDLNESELKKKKDKQCFNGYSKQIQQKGKIPRPDVAPDYYPHSYEDYGHTTWTAKFKYYAKEVWRRMKNHVYEFKWLFLFMGGCMFLEFGHYIYFLLCGKK